LGSSCWARSVGRSSAGLLPRSANGPECLCPGCPTRYTCRCHRSFELRPRLLATSAFCYWPRRRSATRQLVSPEGSPWRSAEAATPPGRSSPRPAEFPATACWCQVYTRRATGRATRPTSTTPQSAGRGGPGGDYYYRSTAEGSRSKKCIPATARLDRLTVRDGELVLVPEGYHPVVAASWLSVYYLNVLAGSARSMAGSDIRLRLGATKRGRARTRACRSFK